MAPFTSDMCPTCSAETRQRFVDGEPGGSYSFICERCFTVLTYHVDESVECRAATDEERAMVPPPVVWSEQEWAEYRETMRQGYRDLQTWLQDDCPGLTPEIEQALPPRTIDKVRQYMQSVDIDTFMPVEPRRHPPDTNKE